MAYCINFPVGGPKYVMFKPTRIHGSKSLTYRTPVAEADVFVSEALGLAMQALPVIGIDEYAPLIEV